MCTNSTLHACMQKVRALCACVHVVTEHSRCLVYHETSEMNCHRCQHAQPKDIIISIAKHGKTRLFTGKDLLFVHI